MGQKAEFRKLGNVFVFIVVIVLLTLVRQKAKFSQLHNVSELTDF